MNMSQIVPLFDKKSVPHVVKLRRHKGVVVQDCDVYIGRAVNMGGWRLKKSIWGNPFKSKDFDGSVEKVLQAYEKYVLSDPFLVSQLPSLANKRLGCWCVNSPNTDVECNRCHGQVLRKLFLQLLVK